MATIDNRHIFSLSHVFLEHVKHNDNPFTSLWYITQGKCNLYLYRMCQLPLTLSTSVTSIRFTESYPLRSNSIT